MTLTSQHLAFLSLVTAAVVWAAPAIDQIIAGTPAGECEFPSIVHLEVYNQPHRNYYTTCGGTLIDPTHVLTAAHCLDGDVKKIRVNIGTIKMNKRGRQLMKTKTFVKHSGYTMSKTVLKKDIAILKLPKSVKEDDCVQFSPLAQQGESFDGLQCIAAGWGDLKWKGKPSNDLQKVPLKAIRLSKCIRRSAMIISEGILCAGTFRKGGAGTCRGDSGGPLYCPSKRTGTIVLAGVTSFGGNCSDGVNAFSSVSYFRKWIDTHL